MCWPFVKCLEGASLLLESVTITVSILSVNCIENNGLKNRDLYLAEKVIEENQVSFLAKWEDFF